MPSDPPPQEMNRVFSRIHQLGASAERIFSRLHTSLERRGNPPPPSEGKSIQIEQARQMAENNKRLMLALRQREMEVERLNGILAGISEGVIMQDLTGRIVMINQAARDLLGTQKNFRDSELGRLLDSYRDVRSVESELVLLGAPARIQLNNRIIGAQLAAVANAQGDRIGSMILLRDVTEDTIAERLKDQFVTAISHELRTPMTVIKGASELLASLPEDQPINQKLLDTLSRNVDILDRMVVELLDLSEMGAGRLSLRSEGVHMERLLWSVVTSLTQDIKKARLDVSLMLRDVDLMSVNGDEQRLRWAFGHLLQNSIRYTEPGGHIHVAAGLDEEDPDYLAIDIIDSGVGISERDLPRIFERFYRGEARTPAGKLIDPRGLGQGLYIARTVAQAHGGYVTAQSVQGEGSVFTVVLPRASAS